jgi:hypothetical protein
VNFIGSVKLPFMIPAITSNSTPAIAPFMDLASLRECHLLPARASGETIHVSLTLALS